MTERGPRPSVDALLTQGGITFWKSSKSNYSVAQEARECPKSLLKIRIENLKTAIYRRISIPP
jgi:hypothetical protein